MEKLILIGAGGHSKSVIDSIDTSKIQIKGFLDANKTGIHLGFPILGKELKDIPNYSAFSYFISIGDVESRMLWFKKLKKEGLKVVNIIDKSAIVSKSAKLGIGNFVGKMAIVNADAIIGDNNILNTKSLVEHECIVGNHNHLSTNSVINGNVVIENNVFFGSGAICNGQITIHSNVIVGSGSVVIKTVPSNVTVVGVPARVVKGALA